MILATVDISSMKQYLVQSGIKQKWLASNCGMSENALTLSLNSKRELKAPEYLSICNVLGVPPERFVTVKEVPA